MHEETGRIWTIKNKFKSMGSGADVSTPRIMDTHSCVDVRAGRAAILSTGSYFSSCTLDIFPQQGRAQLAYTSCPKYVLRMRRITPKRLMPTSRTIKACLGPHRALGASRYMNGGHITYYREKSEELLV